MEVNFRLYAPESMNTAINRWHMGDGTIMKNKQEFAYTYSKPGVFPVRVSIGNNFSKQSHYYTSIKQFPTICAFDSVKSQRYDYVKSINLNITGYFYTFTSDADGNIYALLSWDRVIVFSTDGNLIKEIDVISKLTDNSYPYLTDIDLDSQKNIYIPDYAGNRILKFNYSGDLVNKWQPCNVQEEGSQCENDKGKPYKITVDSYDDLYVMESTYSEEQSYSYRALKYDRDGNYLSELKLQSGYYTRTKEIQVDTDGNVYTLMDSPYFVQAYNSEGRYMDWGNYGYFDGELAYPESFLRDADGSFYFTSKSTNTVSKFDRNFNFITKFGICEKEDMALMGPLHALKDGTLYAAYYGMPVKIAVFQKRP